MKSKILTFLFACALFLLGATNVNAQKVITLTKQVTATQIQQMNTGELVALLPTDAKLRSEYAAILSTMKAKDKERLRDYLRKTLVNHIK